MFRSWQHPWGKALSITSSRCDSLGLNWILHFGLPPHYDKDVKVIHIDISPEEIGNKVPAHIALVGDANAIVSQWLKEIKEKVKVNIIKTEELMKDESVPMTYYRDIRDILPRDCVIVPIQWILDEPSCKITCPVGFGLAAAMVHPDKKNY